MTDLEKREQIDDIKRELAQLKDAQTHLPKESDSYFVNDLRIKELEEMLNSLLAI
jgi:hypothetical protein